MSIYKNFRDTATVEEYSGGLMGISDFLLANSSELMKDKKVVDEMQEWGRILERSFRVKKNELLLGSTTDKYEDIVVKKFNGDVVGTAIIANKGDGKTQLGKWLYIDQFPRRWDRYLFIVDPKGDYLCLDFPQEVPACLKTLEKVGLKPMQYKPYYCSPQFANIFGARGKEFSFTYRCIDGLENKPLKIEVLRELLNIDVRADSATYSLLNDLMAQGIPIHFDALIDRLRELSQERKEIMGSHQESGKIRGLFQSLYNQGILTDDPSRAIAFPNMLKKHKMMVFQYPLYGSDELAPSSYVKMVLSELLADRKRYVKTQEGQEEGVLDKKITVLIDEADAVVPKKKFTPARMAVQRLFTKERQSGFDVTLITQNPHLVDPITITQSDWLITSRVRNKAIFGLLRERGFDEHLLNMVATKLKHDRQKKPVEWLLHDTSDSKTFFPFPPLTRMITENVRQKA